jgi:predicted nucleotidyltransferase/DNA-binding transcriptional ArsR family regulator
MNFRHPIEAVIPGAQGRVLAVLLHNTGDLNVRSIARIAGVSVAQASRVLPGLVDLGIVERREVPPSSLFRLVPEHVASKSLLALADVRRGVFAELGVLAEAVHPQPRSMIVFGSVSRGDSEEGSDLDLVIVRPPEPLDENQWTESLEKFRVAAQRASGNRVELLEAEATEIGTRLVAQTGVWNDVRREGTVIFGLTLNELMAAHA